MSDLAQYLASSRLAGQVATPIRSCLDNCKKLVAGEPDYTFGLSDWRRATYDDAVAALQACGVDFGASEDPDTTPFVDPAVASAAVERQREAVARWAAQRARVLLATGHAFALLTHYQTIAEALAAAGCTILQPLDSRRDVLQTPDGLACSIRYFRGVASLVIHGALQHTHRAEYMEAMLDDVGGPQAVDAVVGDHGFAGAAVEAGIDTISIADVNDPALPLAQVRGRTAGVLVIDDGLNPASYEPITRHLLSGFPAEAAGRYRG